MKSFSELVDTHDVDEITRRVLERAKNPIRSILETGQCAYRGQDDLACFIGALITDEEYMFIQENSNARAVVETLYKCGRLKQLPVHPFVCFLADLQNIHDIQEINEWEQRILYRYERYTGKPYNPNPQTTTEVINHEHRDPPHRIE